MMSNGNSIKKLKRVTYIRTKQARQEKAKEQRRYISNILYIKAIERLQNCYKKGYKMAHQTEIFILPPLPWPRSPPFH